MVDTSNHRTYDTGATRDTEEGKLRFHAALSPYALAALVDYMRRHNNQAHRCEENWKQGMPLEDYLGSDIRHTVSWWTLHDSIAGAGTLLPEQLTALIDALCGDLFNAFGYLHELTKPGERQMLADHLKPK
jgi:hypothetical protein